LCTETISALDSVTGGILETFAIPNWEQNQVFFCTDPWRDDPVVSSSEEDPEVISESEDVDEDVSLLFITHRTVPYTVLRIRIQDPVPFRPFLRFPNFGSRIPNPYF
jgi:hypothetical protein